MAVPVVESFTKATNSSGPTLTSDKPTGVATGDLLVLLANNDWTSSPAAFTDNKTGWNFVATYGTTSSDSHIGSFWRIADGSEGASESVTAAQDNPAWCLFYIRISGTSSSPLHKETGGTTSSSSSSHAITGVTTTISDCLVIYCLSHNGGDGFPFSVSGTGWAQKDEEQAGVNAGWSSACWGVRDLATAGASGTATVTPSVSDTVAFIQLAIAPGAADVSDQEAPHLFPFMPPQFLQHAIVGY